MSSSEESARRPRLKEVAALAGVSATTASVVLNDRRDGIRVSEETRERVRQAAQKLGYLPNVVARSLRTQSSFTIGFLSNQVTTTPFAVTMLAAAEEAAADRGHLLFVVSIEDGAGNQAEHRAVSLLQQQPVAGFVYACMLRQSLDPPAWLPPGAIMLNCQDSSGRFTSVVPGDYQGAYDAVTELIRHGHRRIAYLDDELHPLASHERRAGYQAALADHGLTPDPRLHLDVYPGAEGGMRLGQLLELPDEDRPTAVFCFHDRMAMGAYRAARYHGLRIPEDISVMGFDDQLYIASDLDPPLTTVRLPHPELGRLAIDMIFGDAEPTPGLTTVPCELIRRQSVAAPPDLSRPRQA